MKKPFTPGRALNLRYKRYNPEAEAKAKEVAPAYRSAECDTERDHTVPINKQAALGRSIGRPKSN
jgi:hypothetical protein